MGVKNPLNKDGWTPLHLAAKNKHLSICRLIYEHVKNNYPNSENDTRAWILFFEIKFVFQLTFCTIYWRTHSLFGKMYVNTVSVHIEHRLLKFSIFWQRTMVTFGHSLSKNTVSLEEKLSKIPMVCLYWAHWRSNQEWYLICANTVSCMMLKKVWKRVE